MATSVALGSLLAAEAAPPAEPDPGAPAPAQASPGNAPDEAATTHPLPSPQPSRGSLYDAIRKRRSRRAFVEPPLTAVEISSLLAFGVGPVGRQDLSRAVDAHLVVHEAEGLEPGTYTYDRARHALRRMRGGDLADESDGATVSQKAIARASALVVFSVDREKMPLTDGARGYRYA
jgi:hypothetical protein